MRFTFRFVNNTQNTDEKTNDIFKGMHNSYSFGINYKSNAKSYEEITLPVLNDVRISI